MEFRVMSGSLREERSVHYNLSHLNVGIIQVELLVVYI